MSPLTSSVIVDDSTLFTSCNIKLCRRSSRVKRRFDVAVVIPLPEEFEATLSLFSVKENLSSQEHIRLSVTLANLPAAILLVQQHAMGKTAAHVAVQGVLADYDVGLIVCLGIAGGLSADVSIGDVVYSEGIVDVLDNAKMQDNEIALSVTHYSVKRSLPMMLQLQRLLEDRQGYEQWQEKQFEAASNKLPPTFVGKNALVETVAIPEARPGKIACAMVSASPSYNTKLRGVDRRILAIETESGGVFAAAGEVPCLTIRGIADYAGNDKNKFEQETRGAARSVAATNAATYLKYVLQGEPFREWIAFASQQPSLLTAGITANADSVPDLRTVLESQATIIDDRLRELTPVYSLQAKGYRLPVPRVRISHDLPGVTDRARTEPIEIRSALQKHRCVLLSLPKEYPDHALAWIVAADLLTADIDQKPVVPVVLEARNIYRPNYGPRHHCPKEVLRQTEEGRARIVFVIDALEFQNRSRAHFLAQEIREFPDATFLVITRDSALARKQSDFIQGAGAVAAEIVGVSFVEIAQFLQKNFELGAAEAEVVATRLRETFDKFELPAHPTFFAGIPKDTLSALLHANRRGELIQLAVAGYLSFVVAGDSEPIALSRTTRERFLAELAYAINVEKQTFSEVALTAYVQQLSERYDFSISPARFVTSFMNAGILHFDEQGRIQFTLTFMEAFLLAKKLHEDKQAALSYFSPGAGSFNEAAFALYCELGPPPEFVSKLVEAIECIRARLQPTAGGHVLLSGGLNPKILEKQDRLQSFRKRLETATRDVHEERDGVKEKQFLFDAIDRIQGSFARKSQEAGNEARSLGQDAIEIWSAALSLIGAGAERLEASVKRDLVERIVSLAALIIDDWTRFQSSGDFDQLKEEMQADEGLIALMSEGPSETGLVEAKAAIASIADVLEYAHLATPFFVIVSSLCADAREKVLAESIDHLRFSDEPQRLIHASWLCDVDVEKGRRELAESIRSLPRSKFLRTMVATQLMYRVFWAHWRKEDRLVLLNLAEEALSPFGPLKDKGRIMRLIEQGREDEAGET